MRRALALALLLGTPAAAQLNPEAQFSPWLSRSGLERCLDAFQLDGGEPEDVIRALHEEIAGFYRERSGPVRAALEDLSTYPRGGSLAWRTERLAMELSFEADVLAVLDDPTRQGIWVRTTQGLRRSRVLAEMRTYRTKRSIPDLVAVVEEIGLADDVRGAVDEELESYGDQIDIVLRQWESSIGGIQQRMYKALNPEPPEAPPPVEGATSRPASEPSSDEPPERDLKTFNRLYARITAMIERAREITDGSADVIAPRLESEDRERFLRGIGAVRFPNAYQRSPVDAVVEALRADGAIDPRRLESVEAVYAGYVAERDLIRGRILEAVEAWERPAGAARRRARWQQILEDGGDPDYLLEAHPVIEHLYRRRALARDTCRTIRSLFTLQELEAFPARARLLLAWDLR